MRNAECGMRKCPLENRRIHGVFMDKGDQVRNYACSVYELYLKWPGV